MCEVSLGHCVPCDSGFWLSGNRSPLLVWWMMTHSLNSVPLPVWAALQTAMPPPHPSAMPHPVCLLCSLQSWSFALHRAVLISRGCSWQNPLHSWMACKSSQVLQELWMMIRCLWARNSSVQRNATGTPGLNLSHGCCCFCCLTDIDPKRIWVVLGYSSVTWIKTKTWLLHETKTWLMRSENVSVTLYLLSTWVCWYWHVTRENKSIYYAVSFWKVLETIIQTNIKHSINNVCITIDLHLKHMISKKNKRSPC